MRFIGDVHGKFGPYKTIIKKYPNTVQVGDMGVGFRSWPHGDDQTNPPYNCMVENNAWFIRGNHDNPLVCKRHSRCVGDGHIETTAKGSKIMFIGGAFSIDWEYRIEGYSYWKDEEVSQNDMYILADKYALEKPDVMVTHDCPVEIIKEIRSHHIFDNSRTQQFLQVLFRNNNHQPKLWIFGHHHISFNKTVDGTKFVCLAELETQEFDI